jgi:uncharacterized protein GlcG (DUF336 family)
MHHLSIVQANAIIEAAIQKAAGMGLKPLGIAVLDAGGHLIAFQRQDGASMLRFEIAFGKAFGALAVGVGSRTLAQLAMERPHFFQGLSGVSGGKVIPLPGGVLVRRDGVLLGAVGVTGDTSDNDEACAVAGVESVGFTAEA